MLGNKMNLKRKQFEAKSINTGDEAMIFALPEILVQVEYQVWRE
jgi:hypothetical protein